MADDKNMSLFGMTSSEKVAYLRGLMDGMKLDENSDTAKLFSVIADILGDISDEVDDISEYCEELADEMDELGLAVDRIEDDLYDDDDDDFSDFDEFDEDSEYYEVVCPKCGDEICVSESILLEGSIECPSCGEMLEFDYSTLTAENINGEQDEQDD